MTNGLGREHPQSDPVHGRSSPGGVDHPGYCAAGSPVALLFSEGVCHAVRDDGGRLHPPAPALRRRAGDPHDGPEDHRHCTGGRLRLAGQLYQGLYPFPWCDAHRSEKKRGCGALLRPVENQSHIGRWSRHGLQNHEERGVYGALPGKDLQI